MLQLSLKNLDRWTLTKENPFCKHLQRQVPMNESGSLLLAVKAVCNDFEKVFFTAIYRPRNVSLLYFRAVTL